jgi:ribosomal protein L27
MAGGKATPKKDKMIKVSSGQAVKTGQILVRNMSTYKAGLHVQGRDVLQALVNGSVYFTKKKTPHGKVRTFLNVKPVAK